MKRKRIKKFPVHLLLSCCLIISGCSQKAVIGDLKNGQQLSKTCATCHGVNGISSIPIYPSLAGKDAEYLVLQLNAFRNGERTNVIMTQHAKSLSDDDIADLSIYYSELRP